VEKELTTEKFDTPPLPCEAEAETYAYAAGEIAPADLGRVERHIAECGACRWTVTAVVRFAKFDESPAEKRALDAIFDHTAQAARALVRNQAPADRAAASPRKSWWDALTAWLRAPSMVIPIAATLMAILAVGFGWAVLSPRTGGDTDLERGTQTLRAAVRDARPSALRLTGFDYAPYRETRGHASTGSQLAASSAALAAAVAENPTPTARHRLAQALIASGDFDAAVVELERAHSETPNDAAILIDQAVALAAKGDPETALDVLSRVLDREPGRPEALFNRAILHERLGRSGEARADLQRYLAADASSSWAQEARSRLAELEPLGR
jgi:tetratricopeptide (TPR) repeat protein